MKSIAHNQFPIIVWREGQKLLWNPIHRKAFKNRPEERVRLRIIDFLIQAGWSKHRITTEEAIKDYSESNLRTDIICYNQKFEPKILAECKAENIALTEKTAEQVARYNQNIQAPYLLISNGRKDLWYRIDTEKGTVDTLDSMPEILSKPKMDAGNFEYWKQRGFAGSKAVPKLRKWLEPVLQLFQSESEKTFRYLQFKKSPSDLNLNHYYHISGFEDQKIALSFLNTPYGGTRMIAILNQEGINRAVAEVNLDLIFEGERPNTSLYAEEGAKNLDFAKAETAELFDEKNPAGLNDLSLALKHLFNTQLK